MRAGISGQTKTTNRSDIVEFITLHALFSVLTAIAESGSVILVEIHLLLIL